MQKAHFVTCWRKAARTWQIGALVTAQAKRSKWQSHLLMRDQQQTLLLTTVKVGPNMRLVRHEIQTVCRISRGSGATLPMSAMCRMWPLKGSLTRIGTWASNRMS